MEDKELSKDISDVVLGDLRCENDLISLFPSNATLITYDFLLENPKVLYAGAHIAVAFRKVKGIPTPTIAWHHGIYVGGGNVIDMNDLTPSIQSRSLSSFMKISDVDQHAFALVNYRDDNDTKRECTVEIAHYLKQSPENLQRKLYNMCLLNCEVFATLCRTGRPRYVNVTNNMLLCLETKLDMTIHCKFSLK